MALPVPAYMVVTPPPGPKQGSLEYRINGGGLRIIGGLEMVQYNNNGGWNNRGEGSA